jgi:hypothetical protein
MTDNIICGVASIPSRRNCLKEVVGAITPQVNRINVYLNGYNDTPSFLDHPKILVFRGDNIGDIGKFFNIEHENGYYFTVDDDIKYPSDYVTRMISYIEKYNKRPIVGVHGAVLKLDGFTDYYKDRNLVHFRNASDIEKWVHILGTGTVAFHTSAITVKLKDFERPNMADVWFSLLAQTQKVPMLMIPRRLKWLEQIPESLKLDSIYHQSKGKFLGNFIAEKIKQYKAWKIYDIKI